MSKGKIDWRTFAQAHDDGARRVTASVVAGLGTGTAAKKRNVVIGHTGITWPARASTGRRGGGAAATAGSRH